MMRLVDLPRGRWLPGDEDFAAGSNPAWDEAVRAGGKELVEARLQEVAEALFEVRSQGPERPLVTPKACDLTRDGCLTGRGWDNGSAGMKRQDTEIWQDAQLPQHLHQFHVAGHDFLGLSVHEVVEGAVPGRRRRTIDRDEDA